MGRDNYWFKVACTLGHQGAGGRSAARDGIIYIRARDIIHALNRYKTIGGVHRDEVPSISKALAEEASKLSRIKGYYYKPAR